MVCPGLTVSGAPKAKLWIVIVLPAVAGAVAGADPLAAGDELDEPVEQPASPSPRTTPAAGTTSRARIWFLMPDSTARESVRFTVAGGRRTVAEDPRRCTLHLKRTVGLAEPEQSR